MDEPLSTKRLLALRKLTRAIAEMVRGQLKDYLTTLAPLLRPRHVFGDYVQRDAKQAGGSSANAAFNDLQTLYAKVAAAKPFNLAAELKPPLEVISAVPEFTNVDYAHAAKTERDTKTITVLSPLKWVLSFSGFGPRQMRAARRASPVGDRPGRGGAALPDAAHRPRPATRYCHDSRSLAFFGHDRPGGRPGRIAHHHHIFHHPHQPAPDELMIESTEISGTDTFEEVVTVSDLASLRDPFRENVLDLAKKHGVE